MLSPFSKSRPALLLTLLFLPALLFPANGVAQESKGSASPAASSASTIEGRTSQLSSERRGSSAAAQGGFQSVEAEKAENKAIPQESQGKEPGSPPSVSEEAKQGKQSSPHSLEAKHQDSEIEGVANSDSQSQEAPPPKREVWRLTLKSGQILRGWGVSQSAEEVVIELAPGVSTTVKRSALASLTVEPAPPEASQPSAQAERETKSDELPGAIGGAGAHQDSSQAPTPQDQEESEGEEDSLYAEHLESQSRWFKDKNRHRYLYAPSAMMNPKGQGSISQIELFFTSFNYSLSDWMNVQVGGALPFWFVDSGFNLIGGVKFGGQVLKYLHLAAGAQNLVMAPDGRVGTIGIAYGATTFGTPDLNLSLLVGMPWQVAAGDMGSSVDLPVINLSGLWRFSEHMAVASENWIFPGSFGTSFSAPYLLSLALRAMTENLSADVGFVVVPMLPFPLPWLSGTWTFGG